MIAKVRTQFSIFAHKNNIARARSAAKLVRREELIPKNTGHFAFRHCRSVLHRTAPNLWFKNTNIAIALTSQIVVRSQLVRKRRVQVAMSNPFANRL